MEKTKQYQECNTHFKLVFELLTFHNDKTTGKNLAEKSASETNR